MNDQLPIPPHSESTERSCLGAMLHDNELISDVRPILDADDYYGQHNQFVYAGIIELYCGKNVPVDLITVANYLNEEKAQSGKKKLEEIGGPAYLADLWEAAPVVANAVAYANEIRSLATLRRLIYAGRDIERLGWQRDGTSPEELAAKASRIIAGVQDRQHRDGLVHISVAIDEALARLDRRRGSAHGGECEGGIETPWAALNNIVVAFNAGELVVVAARPSVGKTLFGLNIIEHATRSGHRTFFASIEQGKADIADRMLAAGSDVNSYCFRSGVFNEAELDAVQHFAPILKSRPLWIDDEPAQGIARIVAQASKMKRKEGLDLVVVDYMGLVDPERRDVNANERMAAISRGLKQLARSMNVPVIALCQLNRDSDKNNRRPKLSDLRDSGAIEQDADAVLLLHKDAPTDKDDLLTVIVGKQRNGPTDEVQLVHRKRTYRIEDATVVRNF